LAERFIWLACILRNIEQKIPQANAQEASELLGKWTQGVNSMIGLGKVLGVERKAKNVPSLQAYVAGKRGQAQ
jgi:hypothetical protein